MVVHDSTRSRFQNYFFFWLFFWVVFFGLLISRRETAIFFYEVFGPKTRLESHVKKKSYLCVLCFFRSLGMVYFFSQIFSFGTNTTLVQKTVSGVFVFSNFRFFFFFGLFFLRVEVFWALFLFLFFFMKFLGPKNLTSGWGKKSYLAFFVFSESLGMVVCLF